MPGPAAREVVARNDDVARPRRLGSEPRGRTVNTAEPRTSVTEYNGPTAPAPPAASLPPAAGAAAAADVPQTTPGDRLPAQHVVAAGEDLAGIAERYYGTIRYRYALWLANRSSVPDINRLTPGQSIVLPPPDQLDWLESLSMSVTSSASHPRARIPSRRPPRIVFRLGSGDSPAQREIESVHDTAGAPQGYRPGDLTLIAGSGVRGEAKRRVRARLAQSPPPSRQPPSSAAGRGRGRRTGRARGVRRPPTVAPRSPLRPPARLRPRPPARCRSPSMSSRLEKTSIRSRTITTNRRLWATPGTGHANRQARDSFAPAFLEAWNADHHPAPRRPGFDRGARTTAQDPSDSPVARSPGPGGPRRGPEQLR